MDEHRFLVKIHFLNFFNGHSSIYRQRKTSIAQTLHIVTLHILIYCKNIAK